MHRIAIVFRCACELPRFPLSLFFFSPFSLRTISMMQREIWVHCVAGTSRILRLHHRHAAISIAQRRITKTQLNLNNRKPFDVQLTLPSTHCSQQWIIISFCLPHACGCSHKRNVHSNRNSVCIDWKHRSPTIPSKLSNAKTRSQLVYAMRRISTKRKKWGRKSRQDARRRSNSSAPASSASIASTE